MCRLSILIFLLFMCNFESNIAKVINVDLKLPVNGKSSFIFDSNKDINQVTENKLNSNEIKNAPDVSFDKVEKKDFYKGNNLKYDKNKPLNETMTQLITNKSSVEENIHIFNKTSHLVSSDYKNKYIAAKEKENQTKIKTSPEAEKEENKERFNRIDKPIKHNYSSEQLDIRALKKRVNITNVTKRIRKVSTNSNFEEHTPTCTQRKKTAVHNSNTNIVENIRRSVPISEDLIDIRLQLSQKRRYDMDNRDSLALYDLKMQSPFVFT